MRSAIRPSVLVTVSAHEAERGGEDSACATAMMAASSGNTAPTVFAQASADMNRAFGSGSDVLRRVDALAEAALKLARTAPSGRLGLARAADAIESEWLPGRWRARLAPELSAAREAMCVPLGARDIERALRSAWGGKPTDELDDLDPEPVAVTPIAQVHRGVLDGAPVAVKVLRPRIAPGVRQDLALLDALVRPLTDAFPATDARAVISELSERVLEELDLEHEAAVQRRFPRALRDHPAFAVAQPHTRLAHENVLVTEWLEGTPFAQAPDPDGAAAQLVRFAIGATRFGTVLAA